MEKVMIFAGTTEGRRLAFWCQENGIPTCVSVATGYGEELLKEEAPGLKILTGPMDIWQMRESLRENHIDRVIDATHPYAAVVTENIRAVCQELTLPYLRLLRPASDLKTVSGDGCTPVFVASAREAKAYLDGTKGNILLTTGSKELLELVDDNNRNRLYPRVLPSVDSIRLCTDQGIPMKQIIAMQGPFSEEINAALLRQFQCRFLVTKESGTAGGFLEKLQACSRVGAVPVVIGRPKQEQGFTLWQVMEQLIRLYDLTPVQDVQIVGIGMGTEGTLTADARAAILTADGLVGGARMLALARSIRGEQKAEQELAAYDPRTIRSWIRTHRVYRRVAVLMSGDIGFYSGAARLKEELLDLPGVHIGLIPGISSVVYFAGKLGMPWEDMKLVSIHGRRANLLHEIRTNRKVFTLIGKGQEVLELGRMLADCGLGEVSLFVGEQLGYPDERIWSGSARELAAEQERQQGMDQKTNPACSFADLTVVLAVNERFSNAAFRLGIPETEFIRDKVPMTKEEIRCISLAKLRPERDSVIFDIGAGTGSVSVELALAASQGRVYGIEKKPLAIQLLQKNRERFGLENLEIVEGTAPEALRELPAPTHAFIGGSGGNLKEIVGLLLEKNPNVRIVVNAIALETIAEVTKLAAGMKAELLTVSVARGRELGGYHMMMGQNPVLIAVLEAGNEDEKEGSTGYEQK